MDCVDQILAVQSVPSLHGVPQLYPETLLHHHHCTMKSIIGHLFGTTRRQCGEIVMHVLQLPLPCVLVIVCAESRVSGSRHDMHGAVANG